MLVPAGWAGAALWTLIAGVVIATALSSLPTGCTHSPEAEWVARWSDATVVLVGWREVWKTAVSTSMWGVPLGWHQLCRGWLRLRWMTWPLESWLKFVFSNIFLPRHSKTQTFQTRLCPLRRAQTSTKASQPKLVHDTNPDFRIQIWIYHVCWIAPKMLCIYYPTTSSLWC